MTTLILLVGSATLAASFFCSLFEAALYAVTPSQVELMKQQKRRGASLLARLRADVEEPIAAILTVNTIAHTVGAAWCGAMVASHYGDAAMGIFATVFTLLVLVLTEIIPKSVGVRYASTLGPKLAWPLQLMTWVVWPIARPMRAAMRFLTGSAHAAGPSEDEVLVFSRLAARHGQVRSEEHAWVQNALLLDKVQARDVMTPRRVVERMPVDLTVKDAIARMDRWIHSRVPVHDPEDPDDVKGIVYRREIFDAAVAGKDDGTLGDYVRELSAVPDTMKAHELLRLFLRERRHLVAVINEHGSFDGIVTLEDILESLLGEEIVDEHDEVADLQDLARRTSRQ